MSNKYFHKKVHAGVALSTRSKEGPGFNAWVRRAFLGGVCLLSLCLCGVFPGAPVSPTSKTRVQPVPLAKCRDEDLDLHLPTGPR